MDWQEASPSTLAAEPSVQALHALLEGQHAVQTETSISAATSRPAAAGVALAAAGSSTRPSEPRELAHSDKPAFQRSAVSYRCETSVRAAAKRSKCPRDRALEARVWRTLSRLTTCSDAAPGDSLLGTGRAQLRLRFAPDAPTIATFSAPTIAPSLNLRAVSKCVAAELSKLRSTRKVDRFELEIGFGLTGRD